MTKKTHHKKPEHHSKEDKHSKDEKEEQLIKEGLEAIYGKDKDALKMDKLDQGKGRATRILVQLITFLIVALVIGAGAWIAYQFINTSGEKEYLGLEIDVEEELVSGEEVEITVNYQNPNKIPVADLDIDVNLPRSFQIQEMTPQPTDEEELVWDLGTLGQYSDGEIRITGRWFEEADSETALQAFANFRPSNFNSEFQEIVRKDVKTERSILEITAEADPEASAGNIVSHSVQVKNTSEDLAMENVTVLARVADGFFLEESTPEVEAGGPVEWFFERIEPNEEIQIDYTGSFAGDVEGFQYTDIEASVEIENRRYVQASSQVFTDVLSSTLSALLVINGSTDSANERLGGTLRTSVSLENTGNAVVTDAALLLNFEGDSRIPVDWDRAGLDGGRVTQDGIYWSPEAVGEIKENGNATFNLNLPILDELSDTHADTFRVTAEVTSGDITIKSTPVTIGITTDANLSVSARYYDTNGNQVGRGPLPPVVGEATRYLVEWRITNSLHTLERITVEAELPPYARFISEESAGLGSVSSSGGSITWSVSEIPSNINEVSATFLVEVIPTSSSSGSFIKILPSTTMQVKDSVTGTDIQQTAGAIDSEIPEDEYADGNGVVEN